MCQLQLLTGDHLVNDTREVREADPTDAQDRIRHHMYRMTIRTAEVTICIILERTARSPSTVTVRFGRRHGVIASSRSEPTVLNGNEGVNVATARH